jgi:hypothetical protein
MLFASSACGRQAQSDRAGKSVNRLSGVTVTMGQANSLTAR